MIGNYTLAADLKQSWTILKTLNWGLILASIQTCVAFAAAVGYLFAGDYKRTVYWLCAGGITAVVTWWF